MLLHLVLLYLSCVTIDMLAVDQEKSIYAAGYVMNLSVIIKAAMVDILKQNI